MEKLSATVGTQSLRRGLSILGLLSEHHQDGLRLTDITEQLQLERSTAHRLLACLCEEQFVEKGVSSKRYHLGFRAMHMGYAVSSRLPLVERYRPVMQRLARISGDNVFLVARQGDFGVCLHREEGSFPVKITTTVVGGTRPLGIGAAGLALLATYKEDAISKVWNCHQSAFEHVGLSLAKLLKSIKVTRKHGYAETINIITNGISAVGAVIPGADKMYAAISIGGISQRLPAKRRAELGALLKDSLQNTGKMGCF